MLVVRAAPAFTTLAWVVAVARGALGVMVLAVDLEALAEPVAQAVHPPLRGHLLPAQVVVAVMETARREQVVAVAAAQAQQAVMGMLVLQIPEAAEAAVSVPAVPVARA